MREISIKILEHKPGLLRVTTFYGDEKGASTAENLFASQLVPLIAESLRIAMPQCMEDIRKEDDKNGTTNPRGTSPA